MKAAYLLVAAATISVVLLLGLLGFRFNVTPSLPVGVYRVISDPPVPGSVVHACLPRDVAEFARARGYLGPGSCAGNVRPVGKVVLAVGGDVVTTTRNEIQVNGVPVPNSGTASRDSHGRPLPRHEWGEHRLGADELWLFSPGATNGYDSRYFGPVRTSDVISVLRPMGRR
jgi:conjugative transfer signal peptidase TraF